MNQQVIHDILLPSLELIRKDTKIKRFYFIPGILSVVFLSVLLVYQTVYTYVELLGKSDTLMQYLYKIFNLEYFIEIIVISAIFFVIYSIVIPIYDGALIRYIQQEHEHKQASRSESFGF